MGEGNLKGQCPLRFPSPNILSGQSAALPADAHKAEHGGNQHGD